MEQPSLWLIRPKPIEGELLSSWMVRLAFAQGLKLESFCYRSWGRGAQVMNGDIDLYATDEVFQTLACHTGASMQQVSQTVFADMAGTLFDQILQNGLTEWVTFLGFRKKSPLIQGLSYCPLCIATDTLPYIRKLWRMAFATVCVIHRIRLKQDCPHCGAPFTIHRWDKGNHLIYPGHPITHCPHCRKDRTKGAAIEEVKDVQVIDFQRILENTVDHGWIKMNDRTTDAYLFFAGLAMLASVLLERRRANRLRKQLLQQEFLSLVVATPTKSQRVEALSLSLRYEIMRVLAWLWEDWPTRFIQLCQDTQFSSSYLFDHFSGPVKNIPFWLWEPVYLNLSRKHYAPAEEEIDAVLAYLKRRQKIVKKIDVVRLLGVSWLNKATLKRLSAQFD
jgi:hypothetical protein